MQNNDERTQQQLNELLKKMGPWQLAKAYRKVLWATIKYKFKKMLKRS